MQAVQPYDKRIMADELLPIRNGGLDALVNIYIEDAQTQIVHKYVNGKRDLDMSWSPISFEAAIEVSQRDSLSLGVEAGNNKFYVMNGDCYSGTRYLFGDIDAGEACLSLTTLERHIASNDNCIVALYDCDKRALQFYRVSNGDIDWWYKIRPVDQSRALSIVEDAVAQRDMPTDSLRFYELP